MCDAYGFHYTSCHWMEQLVFHLLFKIYLLLFLVVQKAWASWPIENINDFIMCSTARESFDVGAFLDLNLHFLESPGGGPLIGSWLISTSYISEIQTVLVHLPQELKHCYTHNKLYRFHYSNHSGIQQRSNEDKKFHRRNDPLENRLSHERARHDRASSPCWIWKLVRSHKHAGRYTIRDWKLWATDMEKNSYT